MKLWPVDLVWKFVQAGGVHQLGPDSSDGEVESALAWTLDACQVVPVWERARIYAMVVAYLQDQGHRVPEVFTERMFESEIYSSRPIGGRRGEEEPQEGSSVRAEGGSVAAREAGDRGVLEADGRTAAGERGRRPGRIGIRSDDLPGEEGVGPKPLEGDEGGGAGGVWK